MIVYFSGTGNSRFAAEFLAKQLGDELLDAGRRIKTGEMDRLHSNRPWVFAAPIYAWRMANVMAEKSAMPGSMPLNCARKRGCTTRVFWKW